MSAKFDYNDLLAHCCLCLKRLEAESETLLSAHDDPISGLPVTMLIREILLDSSCPKLEQQDAEPTICQTCFRRLLDIRQFRRQCTKVYEFYESLQLAQDSGNRDQLLKLLADSTGDSLRFHLFRLGITSSEDIPAETLLSDIGFIKSESDVDSGDEWKHQSLLELEVEIVTPKDETYENEDSEESSSNDDEALADFPRKRKRVKKSDPTVCPIPDCQQPLLAQTYPDHLKECHRFECQDCGLLLIAKHSMITHRLHAHRPWTVKCTFCEKMFPTKGKMRQHARYNHFQQPTDYECDECGEQFKLRKLLLSHRESHQPKECSLCDAKFDQPVKLLSHMKNLHPQQLLNCNHCTRKFVTQSALDFHVSQKITRPEEGYLQLTLKSISVFGCDQCEKQFTSEAHRSAHMEIHDHPANRSKTVVKKRSQAELDQLLERKYKCDQCNASYRRANLLEQHKKVHSGTPFVCDTCGAFFTTKSNLKSHVTFKHTRDFRYMCEFCNKGCATSSDLLRHRRVHTDERPYKCDYCEARFKQWDAIRKHLLTHTGEKKYRCDLCEKSFKCHASLKTHMFSHTNEKPVKCFHCNKHFNVVKNQRRHILKWHPGLPIDRAVEENVGDDVK